MQRQINVETTLRTSTLEFATLNNVDSTLSISTLILTTLGNVETNVVIFNVDLHNVDPRRNNVVNMTMKNKLRLKNIIILFKNHLIWICWTENLLYFFPLLKEYV